MTHRCPPALLLLLAILLGPASMAQDGETHTRTAPAPAEAGAAEGLAPILPFDEVRIGMKGYGLTVFAGTKIEPFPVEVVAVVPNETPQRGTIWIICDDPRLDVSGPVQGMSGSPIYLWEDGEEAKPGEGGKLIGAFAFGYSQVEVCLAGVQPIEYMRGVGGRAAAVDVEAQAARRPHHAKGSALKTLAQLNAIADAAGLAQHERVRLDLATKVMRKLSGEQSSGTQPKTGRPLLTPGFDGQPLRLSLPMSVGTPASAAMLTPLFEGTGILPVAGAATIAGKPPASIDVDTPLEAGGVLSVPLVFGNVDLSAAGTITEVLPDGTVIGFGHPMFGAGEASVPMASGYVHFVVPRNSISFKRTGSLKLRGSIVRDEAAAVAGVAGTTYTTIPMTVSVRHNDREPMHYQYDVVAHDQLLPALIGTTFAISATAVHAPAAKSTLRLEGTLGLEGGRRVSFRSTATSPMVQAALLDLLPAITMSIHNPIGPVDIESVDLALTITDGAELVSVESAQLLTPRPRPGDTVKVRVQLRRFESDVFSQTVELTLPKNLTPGEYQIALGGANTYANRLFSAKPYLFEVDNKQDMLDVIEQIMAVDRESLYVMLPVNEQAIAVGRQDMRGLPASKATLIGPAFGDQVLTYAPMIEAAYPIQAVVMGETAVTFTVLPEDEE